jgi:hypothetical protein
MAVIYNQLRCVSPRLIHREGRKNRGRVVERGVTAAWDRYKAPLDGSRALSFPLLFSGNFSLKGPAMSKSLGWENPTNRYWFQR